MGLSDSANVGGSQVREYQVITQTSYFAGKEVTKLLWLRIILESAPRIAIFCLVTATEGQTFRAIPGFYSTSSCTAVIFSAHLVAVKWEVFTTTSNWEIQLCVRPAPQLTRSPLLPANRVRQPIAHARRFKGPIRTRNLLKPEWSALAT